MIKTALSASLIALAVLAPVASAADEVKPPRHTEPAAVTCRTPAPAEVDPKAPPAPRLTKAELEALNKLPLCPAEQAAAPQEACPPYDKLVLAAETAKYCAELAAVKPDKKGVVTLTKEQLAFQSTFDCPVERPADCPDEAKQEKLDKTVKEYATPGSDAKPARLAHAVLPARLLARQAEQDRAGAARSVRPQRHRQRQAPGLIMLKTALSASLIALAVLAPAASAADEVKPPRQTDQAAPTCRDARARRGRPEGPAGPEAHQVRARGAREAAALLLRGAGGDVPDGRRGRVRQADRGLAARTGAAAAGVGPGATTCACSGSSATSPARRARP